MPEQNYELVGVDEHDAPSVVERFEEIQANADEVIEPDDNDEALFQDLGDFTVDEIMAEEDEENAPEIEPRRPVYAGPNLGNAPAQAAIAGAVAEGNGTALVNQANAVGAPAFNPQWRPIYELPGYMGAGPGQQDRAGEAIRSLGRTIFRSFPCFRRMQEECRQHRRDPLGEVQVLANIAGTGPNSTAEIDQMANWIRTNGMMVNASQVEFPNVMRGYRPNLILAASEDDSFLMVEERRANGAPMDATFIYSWRGGRQTYIDSLDAMQALENMGGVHAVQIRRGLENRAEPEQVAIPANVQNPVQGGVNQMADRVHRPGAGHKPEVIDLRETLGDKAVDEVLERNGFGNGGAAAAAATAEGGVKIPRNAKAVDGNVLDEIARTQAEDAAAAEAARPKLKENAMKLLRASGFMPVGTETGPALRKELDDGNFAQVKGHGGKSLTLAKKFDVYIIDAGSNEPIASTLLGSAEEIEDWIAENTTSSLKM